MDTVASPMATSLEDNEQPRISQRAVAGLKRMMGKGVPPGKQNQEFQSGWGEKGLIQNLPSTQRRQSFLSVYWNLGVTGSSLYQMGVSVLAILLLYHHGIRLRSK